jgi:hypothetical protein
MRDVAAHLWSLLGGESAMLDQLELVGDRRVLPSVFDVTAVATAAVGVATLAVAELGAARGGRADVAVVGTREAAAAFRCERLFTPLGWSLPPMWDEIAGDYPTADGWIRLHTNYRSHRDATLRALGLRDADRERVAAAVAGWNAGDLETRVVDEGGAAAAMRRRDDWLAHPHGRATASARPVEIVPHGEGRLDPLPLAPRPLEGVRVLDLTRVIAGPAATRFLAAWGADVLRIDPPGFEEVPVLVPEGSAGKRCAALDLKTGSGRRQLLDLVRRADVFVHGYRPGALAALGFDDATLREINPALVVSQHNTYGWDGPWAQRRGFDSLVQMSCGIAAAEGGGRPTPLPAQVLDHATSMHVAAAICRALTIRQQTGVVSDVRASLIGVANLLWQLLDPAARSIHDPALGVGDTELRVTSWGPARAVPIPGRLGDERPRLDIAPGPLGRDEPAFRGDLERPAARQAVS